jgi:hypothetical protein
MQFAVILLLLLFTITIIFVNNSVLFGQTDSLSAQMSAEQIEGEEVSISSVSEWIGIFSIGMVV